MPPDELLTGLDLMVGIGGDGTILRAVRAVADHDVPVLGINAGNLGYLTVIEPSGARAAIKRFLAGAYTVEERMRIATEVVRVDGTREAMPVALNEAMLERGVLGHTVRIEVLFDNRPFTSYLADGMIVATPTGSTAYALSARGPIVDPMHRALMMVPVAPHMLFDRALVLSPTTMVGLRVAGDRAAHLSIDGQSGGTLLPGDRLECTAARRPAKLLTLGTTDFHSVLKAKFALSDR